MTETFINLNVHEIGIMMSALRLLSTSEENQIAKEFGSAPALYNKLYSYYEQMNKSQLGLTYDMSPSY